MLGPRGLAVAKDQEPSFTLSKGPGTVAVSSSGCLGHLWKFLLLMLWLPVAGGGGVGCGSREPGAKVYT